MRLKRDFIGFFNGKCHECGSNIEFGEVKNSIIVRNYTERGVQVPGMLNLWQACPNPNCKWSKLGGNE
jgi:hypothetical protein